MQQKAHMFGFLAALAMQLAGVWGSSDTDVIGKICLSITALLALLFTDPLKRRTVAGYIVATLPIAAVIVTIIKAKVAPGAATFGMLSTLAAVFTRLASMLPVQVETEQRLPKPPVGPLSAACVLLAGSLLVSSAARADALVLQVSDTWTCSPVASLTGYQYNASTKTFQQDVGLGAGVGCRYTGWRTPLGVDLVGGATISANSPNAAQGSLIFTVADNFGVGPGMRAFKDPSTGDITAQFLVSFFLTGSWAATIDQFTAAKQRAAQKARAEAALQVQPGDTLTIEDF